MTSPRPDDAGGRCRAQADLSPHVTITINLTPEKALPAYAVGSAPGHSQSSHPQMHRMESIRVHNTYCLPSTSREAEERVSAKHVSQIVGAVFENVLTATISSLRSRLFKTQDLRGRKPRIK